MSDLYARAEAALETWPERVPPDAPFLTLIAELVAALKAKDAEHDQSLEDFAKNYAHMTKQLAAKDAELEAVRAQLIRSLLSEVYKPEGVEIWLKGVNRNLGPGIANELIANGKSELVLDEVKRLVGGCW